jgi:hypothetical protein
MVNSGGGAATYRGMTWLSVAWAGPPLQLLEERDPLGQAALQVAADGAPEGAIGMLLGRGFAGYSVYLVGAPEGEPPVVRVLRTYSFEMDGTLFRVEEGGGRKDLGKQVPVELPPLGEETCGAVHAARTALPALQVAIPVLPPDDERDERLAVVAPREGGWTVQLLRDEHLLLVQLDPSCEVTGIDVGEAVLPSPGGVYAAYRDGLGALGTPRVAGEGWTLEGEVLEVLLGRPLPEGLTVRMEPGAPVLALALVPALLAERGRRGVQLGLVLTRTAAAAAPASP